MKFFTSLILAVLMTATTVSARTVTVTCDNGLTFRTDSSYFLDQGKKKLCKTYKEELRKEDKNKKTLIALNKEKQDLKKLNDKMKKFLDKIRS